jgi:hypothetical protein
MLDNSQIGFRKLKSTKDAIASVIDGVIEYVDNKLYSNSVFFNLSKAFDCIEHTLLVNKLYQKFSVPPGGGGAVGPLGGGTSCLY